MKTRIIVLLLGLFLLASCSLYRESLVEMSREDVKNAEAVREAAINFLSTWNLNSGFIRGALGPRLDEFPAQFIVAMDELDDLADYNGEFMLINPKLTDYNLGYSLGLRVRTLEVLVQNALKIYAPDILKYLPFPLKF